MKDKKITELTIMTPKKSQTKEIIMPESTQRRSMDAIRGLIEEQQNQINDLTEIIRDQTTKINNLQKHVKEREHMDLQKQQETDEKIRRAWFFP